MAAYSPEAESALLDAARWLEGLIIGPVATTLAVLAIAATGFMMLNGRLSVRKGLAAVLGCFILFGAPAIARGLMSSAASIAGSTSTPMPVQAPLLVPTADPSPAPAPDSSDPYAGASVRR